MKYNFFSPRVCICCNFKAAYDEFPICPECMREFQLMLTRKCINCGKTARNCSCSENDKVRFLFFYGTECADKIVWKIKYDASRRDIAFIAGLMVSELGLKGSSYDAVTFVPRIIVRRLQFGYDQSALLAEETAKLLGIPCIKTMRRKGRKEQKLLSRAEREKNIIGKFKLIRDVSEFDRLLLIDDVSTTGATVAVCKKLLHEGGVAYITPAVVSKTILRINPKGTEK